MSTNNCPMSAKEILDVYFIENRARLLDIASFLDRVDRCKDSQEAKNDFRYRSFIRALKLLLEPDENHPSVSPPGNGGITAAIQLSFSDLTAEPLESSVGLKAVGAWEGSINEDN